MDAIFCQPPSSVNNWKIGLGVEAFPTYIEKYYEYLGIIICCVDVPYYFITYYDILAGLVLF